MSLTYFLDWLKLEQVSTVEPLPGIPPNPDHIAKVLNIMRQTQTHVIIQEQHYPRHDTETLAKLTGAQLIMILAGTRFDEGESYITHIQDISNRLYMALNR